MRNDPVHEAWIETARAVTTIAAAERLGFKPLGRPGVEVCGPCPCPGCGGRDRFSIVLKGGKAGVFHCRGCGIKGADAIGLVSAVQGVDFLKAVEFLAGQSPRGSTWTENERKAHAAEQERLKLARVAHAARREEQQQRADAARVRLARRVWAEGSDEKPLVHAYLAHRKIVLPTPAPWGIENLRQIGTLDYRFNDRVVWRGPVMLAQIQDARGRFIGVHRTWIHPELETKNGRPYIRPSECCDALPTKKVLGVQHGGAIRLVRGARCGDFPGDRAGPEFLFLGEGIETVLSVYAALIASGSAIVANAAFWSGISLGNLAHVTAPPSVRDVVLLGDGDSDPVKTRAHLDKARESFESQGKRGYIAMAPDGKDFSDLLMEAMG
ncbi:DUF7146 domain-containing protein [Methylovirgula sp. 4M-Z18]|uniref:DUF7146 domain-containing protein n=1 Tax=Methylovirgula sp. 4M-Z18 TaxID=2293567 RepID=UPI000E2F1C88|nr:toprim domain-containing protein [Methylovirgula sp. 4M-Z18]RFB80422.1 hypothetical protein DYH55_02520 [Methylovirgula sp. 4M-Z18]